MAINELNSLIKQGMVWYPSGEKVSSADEWSLSGDRLETKRFSFGAAEVDAFMAEYPCFESGAVHEIFFANELAVKSRNVWFPAAEVVSQLIASTVKTTTPEQNYPPVFWLGSKIFPSAHLLKRTFVQQNLRWEHSNFFVDPDTKELRQGVALDLLRSSALFALVMDGSGLNLKATRQLQLAAEKCGAFCFLLRPPWEVDIASSAHTKWRISPLSKTEGGSAEQRLWKVELYKAKGARAPVEWVIGKGAEGFPDEVLEEKRLGNFN